MEVADKFRFGLKIGSLHEATRRSDYLEWAQPSPPACGAAAHSARKSNRRGPLFIEIDREIN
jgi:hypothetical protein